jgi:hypothetical protein
VGVCRWPRSERFGDYPHHASAIFENVVVPKPQHAPTVSMQDRVATVMFSRTRMLTAVGFNDQSGFDAHEINNVGWYRKLSAEPPAEAVAAQLSPQQPLSIRHTPTQIPGSIAHRWTAAHVVAARYPHPNPPQQAGEGAT